MSLDLESVAEALVAEGKGILAADETVPTLTRRFDTLGIQSTEQSRRTYREMLFRHQARRSSSAGLSCKTKPSVRRAPTARRSARFYRIWASFRGSRSMGVQSRSPAFPAKP